MGIKFRAGSLRQKFYLAFAMITFFLLCLFTVYIIILYFNMLNYEQEKINLYIKSVSVNIDNDIKELIQNIEYFTKSEEFAELNRSKIKNCISHFKQKKYIDLMLITGINDEIIISSGKESEYINEYFVKNNIYKTAADEKKIIISENLINGRLLTAISAPIYKNGSYKGMFTAILNFYAKDIDILNNVIDPGVYKWEILLTNKKGYIIYHSHQDVSILKDNELDFSKNPAVKNALLGRSELSKIIIDGKDWYTASEYIHSSSWLVIVQVPSGIIIQKVINIIFPSLLSLLAVILILLILIYFLSYFLINPLILLTNSIKDYGESGHAEQLKIKGDDELSNAMSTFNKMITDKTKMDREILEFIERDRKRTGKSLHIELEEYLSSIYKNLLILKEEYHKITDKDNKYLLLNIDKIENLLNYTINKTKLISNGLYPVSIDKGISSSIIDFLKNIESSFKIKTDFHYDKDIHIADEQISLNIYYIIQEAVNISVKYNDPHYISIIMKYSAKNIEIQIADDGRNITEDENKKMSIRIMNYIAKLINGNITTEHTDNGSIVICRLKSVILG